MGELLIDLFIATVRVSTPLVLAGLGGVISERSGVLNISLEGHMLLGAFVAVAVSFYTGSPWLGTMVAGFSGVLLAVLMGYMTVILKTNQIVVAMAINLIAVGITSFMLKLFNIHHGLERVIIVNSFSYIRVPFLADLLVVGRIFSSFKPLTYVAVLLVIVLHLYFYKTKIGLLHRAVGEHPQTADTLGIKVNKVRYLAVLACGFLCGIAGAYLSVSNLNQFQDEMVSGRGFIAFAAVIFGRWNPLGVALAAMVFGAADAIQMRIQTVDVQFSYHLLQAIPYLLTMLALVWGRERTEGPAANGIPYRKEG